MEGADATGGSYGNVQLLAAEPSDCRDLRARLHITEVAPLVALCGAPHKSINGATSVMCRRLGIPAESSGSATRDCTLLSGYKDSSHARMDVSVRHAAVGAGASTTGFALLMASRFMSRSTLA